MQTTYRDLLTSLHGILFGGFFLVAFFAATWELLRRAHQVKPAQTSITGRRLESTLYISMAVSGWLAVLTGTFLVYPWYRATPPPGTADLLAYPRSFLLSHPEMAQLHTIGMEWKEHIGWIAPILSTMCAAALLRHRETTQTHPRLRRAVVTFAFCGFLATAIAGLTGALLDKTAPVTGGDRITLGGQP
jgi:hypothetical protein